MQGKGLDSNYTFTRWHYGPYCNQIKEDLLWLQGLDLIFEQMSFLFVPMFCVSKNIKVKDYVQHLSFLPKIDLLNNHQDFKRLGIKKYLSKVYTDYEIESYETGAVIPCRSVRHK